MYLNIPVRTNKEIQCFNFENVRIFNEEDNSKYMSFLVNTHLKKLINESEISLIGSDINKEAIKSSIENFSKLIKETNFDESELIEPKNVPITNPTIFQHTFLKNRIQLFLTDFENLTKITSLKETCLITNPPYGYRSRSHINFNSLKNTYIRFRRLLRKNLKDLDEVYVLYPLDTKSSGSLMKLSGLAWNLLENFENGGIRVGLFQLNKEKTKMLKKKESNEIIILNERLLQEKEKIEEKKEIMLKKEDPTEREKRKQELFKEEHELRVEAKKWTKKLKFPRNVEKRKTQLRQILHDKEKEFIRRRKYKKLVEYRRASLDELKEKKAKKSSMIRSQKGHRVIRNLVDENTQKSEDFNEKLQIELNKSAIKKIKKFQGNVKERKKTSSKNSKW